MTRLDALREAAVETARPYVAALPQGTVRIESLAFHDDHVDVWITDVGGPDREPEFRIYNPPLAVEDPAQPDGLRIDPMLALAQVIAVNGGASRR